MSVDTDKDCLLRVSNGWCYGEVMDEAEAISLAKEWAAFLREHDELIESTSRLSYLRGRAEIIEAALKLHQLPEEPTESGTETCPSDAP